jgi:hypothetical protein
VIGSKSEKRIVKTFFKQFPDLEEFLTEEMKFYKKFKINNNTDRDQKVFIFILVFLLILFFITIVNN